MERIDIKKETEGMTMSQFSDWYKAHSEQIKAQEEQDRLDRIEDKRKKMRLIAKQFKDIDRLIKWLMESTKKYDGKVWGDKLKDSINKEIRDYVKDNCPSLFDDPSIRYGNNYIGLGHSYASLGLSVHITRYGDFSILYDYEDRNTVVSKIKGGFLDGELVTEENVKKWTDGKIERVQDFNPRYYQGSYSNLSYFSHEGFKKSLRYTEGELLKNAEELERDAERVTDYMEELVQAMKNYNRALDNLNYYGKYVLECEKLSHLFVPSELHYMGYSEDK